MNYYSFVTNVLQQFKGVLDSIEHKVNLSLKMMIVSVNVLVVFLLVYLTLSKYSPIGLYIFSCSDAMQWIEDISNTIFKSILQHHGNSG